MTATFHEIRETLTMKDAASVPAICGLFVLAACSAISGAGSGSLTALQTASLAHGESRWGASPHIFHVTRVRASQTQTFTIVGDGFGTNAPYFGDSPYFEMYDLNDNWRAGCGPPWGTCGVTVNVTSWTSEKIVVSGFGGTYGKWVLHRGDPLIMVVWNPQTGGGPAIAMKKVR